MYIFIFEDGSVKAGDIIQDGDLMAAENGILDIIDIRKPDEPKQYFDGEWQDVERV